MRVPKALSDYFQNEFESKLEEFLSKSNWIPDYEENLLNSKRYLSRSIAPHIEKLSSTFNRLKKETPLHPNEGAYWKDSSHPKNLKLAYFLSFMPPNMFRMASVWSELSRLGFSWPFEGDDLKAVDFGAGPATSTTAIAIAEQHSPIGIPRSGSFALI